MRWDETTIHVIDFEGGPHCGIVEYGVVSLKGDEIARVSTRLCKPKAPISRKEQALHGIATGAAEGQQPFDAEWDQFAGLRETGPLAAHFATAENTMLKSVFPYPRLSPDWGNAPAKIANWAPWIDTGVLYRDLGDDGSTLKLQDLVIRHCLQAELDRLAAAYCPEGRRKFHCALYDALGSALLLLLYCRELCDGPPSLNQLVARSQGSAVKRQEVEQQRLF